MGRDTGVHSAISISRHDNPEVLPFSRLPRGSSGMSESNESGLLKRLIIHVYKHTAYPFFSILGGLQRILTNLMRKLQELV